MRVACCAVVVVKTFVVTVVLCAVAGLLGGGVVGAAAGAVLGGVAWCVVAAAVLTPWIRRAALHERGVTLHGSRLRGRVELWDGPAREVTVVTGRLRRQARTRWLDRREALPPAPRQPPRIRGVWPLPVTDGDPPAVRRALARARRYRSLAETAVDERSSRGR